MSKESAQIDTNDPLVAADPIAFQHSGVSTLRELSLGQGAQLRQYRNAHEHVYYEDESRHTFSIYLEGGYQTHRTDISSPKGAPGRFCLMPAGSYSAWHVGGPQQFLHIYFDDSYIKRLALKTFDIDPRRVELPQLSFAESDALMAMSRYGLLNWDWNSADNTLALQQGLQTLLLNMLKEVGIGSDGELTRLTAGLAPRVQRQVQAFIRANYHRQIYLSELAGLAGQSEYHFCRMFKVSFAESPQQYIARVRIEQIQCQLQQQKRRREQVSLADLALASGFSSQSHMGRVFKQQLGITPGQYLKSL
ncbi:MAG: AraC family transcriptional regulator [Chromatiales bacterium]|nr:AraC family transcriptional regulator [Chromatiales bacterium]